LAQVAAELQGIAHSGDRHGTVMQPNGLHGLDAVTRDCELL
jgi:hypothetical protein